MVTSGKEEASIVLVGDAAQGGARAEEVGDDGPDVPAIGRWYWTQIKKRVEGNDGEWEDKILRELGCVTHLGSNYVEMSFVDGSTARVHHDRFWVDCEFVHDAPALLRANADGCKRKLDSLLEEVKLLTTRLGVAPSLALGSGEGAGVALALASSVPATEYKAALVKAREETLPELFKRIKKTSAEYATWLSAEIIPAKAEAKAMQPAIMRVADRIFSVELYAGLCEQIERIRDGEPAMLTEPIHLFQRRLYMDEECLANYDTGGMEFKNLHAFERWLLRKDNLSRIFPFPRTAVAFQVRHREKERDVASFRDFIKMLRDKDLDKLTFLYVRNGEQVFRLSTEIDFGERLFPDADHPVLSAGEGNLWAKGRGDDFQIIGDAEHRAMVEAEEREQEEYERLCAEEEKKPKKDREHVSSPDYPQSHRYEPFTKANVNYDDIAKEIQKELEKHNRIVLVLQGLLDRSPALHPHPPWRLHSVAGFREALRLHRDMDRVLAPGDVPDFEAYRAKLNASIGPGTVTVGQEDAWERFEARKENTRRDHDRRFNRTEWRPETYRPEGDPGPGRFARVLKVDGRGYVHYRWEKERLKGDGPPVSRRYACKALKILNVDAYQSGDYKRFYTDPRTREEYLQWAPLLLAAEEYKAGRHGEVPPLKDPPKKASRPAPTGEALERRMLRSWPGKAVRLTRPIETTGGKKYAKGSLWRVTHLERGAFRIQSIDEEGKLDPHEKRHSVWNVSHHSFVVESSIPFDSTWEHKVERRKRFSDVDDEEGSDA